MADRSLGAWLYHLEHVHPAEIELGLDRVRHVASTMGLLSFSSPVLTIAGTNGKGSVAHASDAILRAHGRKTGRYTSPHLLHYNERICIDGQPVADALIVEAFVAIEHAREETTLTYFEFSTLAAFWVFRKLAVDVLILEVGLGGRLDAVNVVDCDVAVVTAIDLDHQHWLGDTVEAIAPEKAAVARPDKPVVLAEHDYPESLTSTLEGLGATMLRAGGAWSWSVSKGQLLVCLWESQDPLRLTYPEGLRAVNVAAAVQASACVLERDLDEQSVNDALAALSVPARRERRVIDDREVIFDVSHNPAAMAALVEYLKSSPAHGKTVAVLGLMADKDLSTMTGLLAQVVDGAWAAAIPGIARAQDPEKIWEALDVASVAVPQQDFSFNEVWTQLLAGTEPGERIVVCGSFHTVAGIMALSGVRPYGSDSSFVTSVEEERGE